LTNTFQANPVAFARHSLEGGLECAVQAGVHLARAGGGKGSFVLGDVGPFGKPPCLVSRWLPSGFRAIDALVVETATDVIDPTATLKALAEAEPSWTAPVLFSLTFCRLPGGELSPGSGRALENCARRARRLPIAALGVNCGRDIGMDEIIEIVRRYRAVT